MLSSLRVVDLTDIRGAMCARFLADLGADVVRIGAPSDDPADSYRNANKRFAPALTDELLCWADVVVSNNGVIDVPDGVVLVVLADFGLDGPRAGWRLEPLAAQAAGGTLFASGFRDMPPCWFPGYLGHDAASVYGFVGAIAAVMDRDRTGAGQLVEVSVQEATLAGTNPWSVAIQDYLKINPFLPAAGHRNADGFYFVLPASDGWVRFVIGNEKQWLGTMALAGHPEALSGPEWLDALHRRMNLDVMRLVMSDAFSDRTRAELFEEARVVGATLGVVHTPTEYMHHPQPVSRRVFTDGMVRPPLEFSAPSPGHPRPLAPEGLLLDGVRVIEFGMAAVGPEASLVLSELGADVIKIESAKHLDVLRLAGFDRVNCAFAFNTECRGRRSVTLNLDTEEGRRLAFELCAGADVVVENYRGGVLDAMGLGYDSVKGANPGVVYASSQGYGRSGPLAEMAAYGPLNLGFAGLHLLWNHPDAPYPCGTSLNHPDHVAGKFLAGGILAALAQRGRTGEGRRVDLAQTEFAAYLAGHVYLDAYRSGVDPVAMGNDDPTARLHGVFPCAGDDRWIAIVARSDEEWAAVCRVTGSEHPAAVTSLFEADELAARLQDAGVSAVPVMGPLDHLSDPHLLERGYLVTLHHPEVGEERQCGNPIRMSVTSQRVAPSAPCLGADTVAVLGEVLGLSESEVNKLIDAGECM